MPPVLPLCGYWSKASGFCSPISKPRDVPRGICSLFPREDASARGGASCSPPQPDGPAKSLGAGRLTSPRAGAVNKSREERLILWARSLAQFFLFVIQASPNPSLPYLRGLGFSCLGEMDAKREQDVKTRAGMYPRQGRAVPEDICAQQSSGCSVVCAAIRSNPASSTLHPKQSLRAPAPALDSSEAAGGSWAVLLVVSALLCINVGFQLWN